MNTTLTLVIYACATDTSNTITTIYNGSTMNDDSRKLVSRRVGESVGRASGRGSAEGGKQVCGSPQRSGGRPQSCPTGANRQGR